MLQKSGYIFILFCFLVFEWSWCWVCLLIFNFLWLIFVVLSILLLLLKRREWGSGSGMFLSLFCPCQSSPYVVLFSLESFNNERVLLLSRCLICDFGLDGLGFDIDDNDLMNREDFLTKFSFVFIFLSNVCVNFDFVLILFPDFLFVCPRWLLILTVLSFQISLN